MDYAVIRPLIKSGDLLAFSHESWGSLYDLKVQLVRMATRSEYAHVAIAWVIGDRVFALEAVRPEIRNFPLSKLGDFYHLPLDIEWTNAVEEHALSHIGEPYSQLLAISAFFQKIKAEGCWECALYAQDILKKAGRNLDVRSTPTELVKEAQRQGASCRFISNKEGI